MKKAILYIVIDAILLMMLITYIVWFSTIETTEAERLLNFKLTEYWVTK